MFVKNKISSVQDVTEFFSYIYNDRGVNFHPDDGFDRYINLETKQPAFSADEIKTFDRLMVESFNVCEDADIDIYDLACELRDHLVTA